MISFSWILLAMRPKECQFLLSPDAFCSECEEILLMFLTYWDAGSQLGLGLPPGAELLRWAAISTLECRNGNA